MLIMAGLTARVGIECGEASPAVGKQQPRVLVACPDARPPGYEAAAGLAGSEQLDAFVTAFYHREPGALGRLGRRILPGKFREIDRRLMRRRHAGIPPGRVEPHPFVDGALALENRIGPRSERARRGVIRWRTARFDRALASALRRRRPDALLVFSDVGSEVALPACRKLGIPAVLSMVHGDVREEQALLEVEAAESPEWFPLYLGDAALDREELAWLHRRRLRELELADRVLVPSEHIAGELARHGLPRHRIEVIPYAADTSRFVPEAGKRRDRDSCTFLFAGGISQRKGIKALLEAWEAVRRPGWRLQLLGAMPRALGPIARHLDSVEVLGRVGHAEMPARLAAADVFVFPSLFEGSAVVTYEAMACGLPIVTTPNAGSVARDGVEGLIVPAREPGPLAAAMERLGSDPSLRAEMSAAARLRALAFDWPRYHRAIREVMAGVVAADAGGAGGNSWTS
jgi:starch synthase